MNTNTNISKPEDSNFAESVQNQENSEKDEKLLVPSKKQIQNQNNDLIEETNKPETEMKTDPPKVIENDSNVFNEELKENKIVDNNVQDYPNIADHMNDQEALETQSTFFKYFVAFTIICIIGYLVFHNKKEIIALVLEGRRRNPSGRGGRRSSSAQYRKLDNNLEEAMADNSDDNLRHVIY